VIEKGCDRRMNRDMSDSLGCCDMDDNLEVGINFMSNIFSIIE
jgi:hypothetical protein